MDQQWSHEVNHLATSMRHLPASLPHYLYGLLPRFLDLRKSRWVMSLRCLVTTLRYIATSRPLRLATIIILLRSLAVGSWSRLNGTVPPLGRDPRGATRRDQYGTTAAGSHHVLWIYMYMESNNPKRISLKMLACFSNHSYKRTNMYTKWALKRKFLHIICINVFIIPSIKCADIA